MDEVSSEQKPPSGVKPAAGELLRAYRAIDKVDRWSGGGQTLALVVKIFGWVGLVCVLWVLVVKVNDIADSVDPVKNGIARLATQLEESRAAIAAEDARRRENSQRLSAAAAQLAESTQQLQRAAAAASAAQTDAAQVAADAAKELREAAEKRRGEANDNATAS